MTTRSPVPPPGGLSCRSLPTPVRSIARLLAALAVTFACAVGRADDSPPVVTNVTSPTASGVYKAGDTILVRVTFSEPVFVTGTPTLALETGDTDRTVNFTGGSGTANLTFTYDVQATDETTDLDYKSASSLALAGGTIKDAAGNNATRTLPTPGDEGSLSNNKTLVVDNTSPVSYATAGGTYSENFNAGLPSAFNNTVPWKNNTTFPGWYINYDLNNVIPSTYRINFVSAVGAVQQFRTDANATNGALGGRPNNTTDALMYAVRLVNDTGATLTEFTLGYKGEQWYNSDEGVNNNLIVSYQLGPQVHLDNGTWTEIPALKFNTPHDGDDAGTAEIAADLNGHAGANSEVFAPVLVTGVNWAPGTELWIRWFDTNSTDSDHGLALDDVAFRAFPHSAPAVTSVTAPTARAYRSGETLTFTVNFDHNVDVSGSPALSLNIGGINRTATFAEGSGTTALTFSYTVQAAEMDPDGITVASPLTLNGGTINDAYGRAAALTFTLPDTTGVLVDNRPAAVSFSPTDGASSVDPSSNLVVTFNEAVTAVAGKNIVVRRAADDTAVATIAASDTARVTIVDDTVTIDLPSDLLYSTAYYVEIDAGAFVNAATLGYPGIANTTTWNFATETRTTVTATDSAAFASYFANTHVSTINLVGGTTYEFTGGTAARTLTINGQGATLQAGAGVTDNVVRSASSGGVTVDSVALENYLNVRVLFRVEGSGSELNLHDVTLKNGPGGLFAIINVKTGGSLTLDQVTLLDFHNNPTPGNNLSFGIHAEPGAVSTTITNSHFDASNAFRNAVAIRSGLVDISGNTFAGTLHPERLRQADGYEYAMYLYGGSGTVQDNEITGYDSTTQLGYASAGIVVIGFYHANFTIENNTLAYNESGIDVTRTWSPYSSPTPTVTINGTALATSEDAYAIGEKLREANEEEDYVSVSLDQTDEVKVVDSTSTDPDPRTYFTVLGGYRSPFLTVTAQTPNGATLNFPTDAATTDILNAATAIAVETQKDDEATWSEITPTWSGLPTSVPVTYTPGHVYRYRAKLTHLSDEQAPAEPRPLVTYSAPVTIDVSLPSITSALTASGTYGSAFSYQITATNTPTSYAATNLPSGLSLNSSTGLISGSPAQSGTFNNISLTATNGSGTSTPATLVLTIGQAGASVSLASLTRTYTGQPLAPTVTTSPSGLPVTVTYNGSTTVPTDVGSYNVVATVSDPDYSGSGSGTFTITKATATVSLGNLTHTYDGTVKSATATTVPAGLNVTLSYDPANPTQPGSYTVTATVNAPNHTGTATGTLTIAPAVTPPPVIPPVGGSVQLTATDGLGGTGHWQRNGSTLPNSTGPSLTLTDVQPPVAGLYTYTATLPGGGGGTSAPVIVGLTTDEKVIGTGEQVLADAVHPNGNVYDQVLLEGNGASITASTNKITRLSFVDLTNDIVQVEFSGAGTLSVVMDDASQPAPPINYNQENVDYVRGHVGLVITGANETSHLSVISVGPITAVNQSLFKEGVTYDGVADVAFVAIQSANGKFGGIRTGNVSYYANQGFTGVYAPGVEFAGPINIGDVTAFDSATPVLVFGSAGTVNITGGSLEQDNGAPVVVSGIDEVRFVNGRTSQDVTLPAQPNQGVLIQDGVDVTDLIVVNP